MTEEIETSTSRRRAARRAVRTLLVAVLTLSVVEPAAAQPPSHRFAASGTVIGALLVGESDDFLDGGYGVEGSFSYRPPSLRYVWLRADLGYLDLSEGRDPLIGAVVDNNIVNLLVGPEVGYAIWRVEPFARAYLGLALNRLSVSASAGAPELKETDAVFAWGLGVGLRLLLARGSVPVSLEMSGRFVDAGELQFARSPDPGTPGAGSVGRDIAMLVLGMGVRVELR